MPHQISESINGNYGTIVIKLANITKLEQNVNYNYKVLMSDGGGYYKGYAVADVFDNLLSLIDSSFTLPDNAPPYEKNSTIEIIDSRNGEIVLTTTIDDILEYGELPVFKTTPVEENSKTQYITSENLGEEVFINYGEPKPKGTFIEHINVGSVGPLSDDKPPMWDDKPPPYNPPEDSDDEPEWQEHPGDNENPPDPPDEGMEEPINEDEVVDSSETDSDSPPTEEIAIVLSESAQWEETSESYTFSLADNLELYIGELDQYIPFEVLLQVNNSNYWSEHPQNISRWLDIEVYQLYGEFNASYSLINEGVYNQTNNPMGIRVDRNNVMGGNTKFRIEINFHASMGELDTVFNSGYTFMGDNTWGVELSSDYSLEENENRLLQSTLTFDTQELNVIPNQYIEDEEQIDSVIDEIKIKRDIREGIFELMYDNFIPNLDLDDLNTLQQTIRDGQLTLNRGDDELLVFTKKDGNVLQQMGDGDNPGDQITNDGGLVDSIYNILTSDGTDDSTYLQTENLKATISQFLTFYNTPFKWCITFLTQEYRYATKDEMGNWINVPNIPNLTKVLRGVTIDPNKARKVLDTDIFELLPPQYNRQQDVNQLFSERLVSHNFLGEVPQFDENGLLSDEAYNIDSGSRISHYGLDEQGEPIGNIPENSPLTRLNSQVNENNAGKTIESLRNTLNAYLKDVDNVVEDIEDSKPEYQNKSEGFLKIRKPNQAIIIRNPNREELDFQRNDSYLTDGFTITMWVRFVGRTGYGTLFSYGNPYKEDVQSRYGFRLETFTVSKKDRYPDYPESVGSSTYITPPNDWPVGYVNDDGDMIETPFYYSDYERFVRLVVWDHTDTEPYVDGELDNDDGTYGKLYDSHFATPRKARQHLYNPKASSQGHVAGTVSGGRKSALPVYFPPSEYGNQGQSGAMHEFAFNYTRIPTDNLDEWFFICATYDPEVDRTDEDRAKVEVISRSDLLRARGYKVEEPAEEDGDTTDIITDVERDLPEILTGQVQMETGDQSLWFYVDGSANNESLLTSVVGGMDILLNNQQGQFETFTIESIDLVAGTVNLDRNVLDASYGDMLNFEIEIPSNLASDDNITE